jgi:RNA polymerase sigma-70 factor (ECF subfamily)
MTIKTEKNNHNEKNYNHGETVKGARRKNSEIWRFLAVNISFIKNLQNIHEKNVTFLGSRALYRQRGEIMSIIKKRKADLTALYERNADMLFRLALSYLQCSADAQDAVQDVFAAYLNDPLEFEDTDHEKAWFTTSVVNRSLDMLRRKKVRRYVSIDEMAEVIAQPEDKAPIAAEVTGYLAKIPEKNRAAVVLHYLEGYSVEEIAVMLDISEAAVKMRLNRGREALRKAMQKEGKYV